MLPGDQAFRNVRKKNVGSCHCNIGEIHVQDACLFVIGNGQRCGAWPILDNHAQTLLMIFLKTCCQSAKAFRQLLKPACKCQMSETANHLAVGSVSFRLSTPRLTWMFCVWCQRACNFFCPTRSFLQHQNCFALLQLCFAPPQLLFTPDTLKLLWLRVLWFLGSQVAVITNV